MTAVISTHLHLAYYDDAVTPLLMYLLVPALHYRHAVSAAARVGHPADRYPCVGRGSLHSRWGLIRALWNLAQPRVRESRLD